MRRRLALLVLLAVTLSGCGFPGIYSLPLPGAVATGAHTYTIRVELADALDLVPFSAVKVADATVGHVKSVRIHDRHAEVVCQLKDSVRLPANATAQLSQTSLLGEKFIQLAAPATEPPTGQLRNGAVIGLASTDTDATVEDVLGALSLLLSGGGLAQLHTIATELSTALDGHEATARDLLSQLTTFATALDTQKEHIIAAVEHIDALTTTVRAQEAALTQAVDVMPSALAILADDRVQLTRLLTSLRGLGTVAVRTIRGSRADLAANLKALRPTLTALAEVGDVIPKTLEAIITYPTADGVEKAYAGDYGNIAITVDTSSASLTQTFGGSIPGPIASGLPLPTAVPSAVASLLPTALPSLPGVPKLPLRSRVAIPAGTQAYWLRGGSLSDLLGTAWR